LHRVLALDVLVTIVIIVLTTLSYVENVSYYVDAALALALLSFTGTLVAVRYVTRRGPM
jgi:multicomponent Na+:H+ antiporter subunit F